MFASRAPLIFCLVLLLVSLVCSRTPMAPPCPDKHFRCTSGECIADKLKCDGIWDCQNGFDELSCGGVLPRKCSGSSDEFRCADGLCLDAEKKCDGSPNCWDASDEMNCPK